MSQKEELLKQIKEKKSQLATARKGSESWRGGGKYKTSGVTQSSKMSMLTLKKEIKALSDQINNLKK